jgi:hypothetical protein
MQMNKLNLFIWAIVLALIRLIIVDTIIANSYPLINWWQKYVIAAILFVIWSVIFWGITYTQITDFIKYKDEEEPVK